MNPPRTVHVVFWPDGSVFTAEAKLSNAWSHAAVLGTAVLTYDLRPAAKAKAKKGGAR